MKKDRLTYWEWLDDEVDVSRVPCCDLFDLDNIPEEERDGVKKLLRRCAELEDDDGSVEVEVEVFQRDVENLTRTLEEGAAEFQEVQHCAEVAERALLWLCDTAMRNVSVMAFPNTKTQVRNKQELYDYCMKQAEKELAEKRKDD